MSPVDRARFEELKEFYALNVVDAQERREVEQFLREHPEHQPEVDEMISVGDLLALAPEELEPSAGLRSNIMATVRAESRMSRVATRREARRPLLEWFGGFAGFGRVALGAAAVVLIGALSWNSVLQRGEIQDLQGEAEANRTAQEQDSDSRTIELKGSAATSGASVEVVRVDGERAVLVAEGLSPIDEGKTLQIWVIKDDVPKPGGVFKPGEKLTSTPVGSSLEDADMVAITVEPAGGSKAPTTDPMLAAKL